MSTWRLLRNAIIGLLTMIIVGFIPMVNMLAPVVGGGVAGYLEGKTIKDGSIAGAVTGFLWTAITFVLLAVVMIGAGLTAPPGVGMFDWLPAAGGATFIAVLFVLVNGVVVALTTVGGAIGGSIAKEQSPPSSLEQPGI